MADNFNLKQYLVENKLGSYSKAVLNEDNAPMDESAPQYKTYADVVNAIAKKYGYKVYHDEIEEFMRDKDSLKAIVAGKDPIKAYEEFYKIQRESKEDPINPDDPYATGPMQGGMFEEGTSDSRMLASLDMLEDKLDNLIRNTTTNSNIPTADKVGLVNAFNEMKELVYTIGSDIEQEEEEEFISDYSKRRAAEK